MLSYPLIFKLTLNTRTCFLFLKSNPLNFALKSSHQIYPKNNFLTESRSSPLSSHTFWNLGALLSPVVPLAILLDAALCSVILRVCLHCSLLLPHLPNLPLQKLLTSLGSYIPPGKQAHSRTGGVLVTPSVFREVFISEKCFIVKEASA